MWSEKPKPFIWAATVNSIVEQLSRCRLTLEQIKPGCTLARTKKNQEGRRPVAALLRTKP